MILSRNIFCAATLAMLAIPSSTLADFNVGDVICVEGYVMDTYCIDNGVMLDNQLPTLQAPQEHNLLCLVDVPVCLYSNFEILADPVDASSGYGRGFKIDEDKDELAGKSMVVDAARTVGSQYCASCFGGGTQDKGFRAVAKAMVLEKAPDPDSPSVIQVQSAFASNDQVSTEVGRTNVDDPCGEFFEMAKTVASDAVIAVAEPEEETQAPTTGDGSGAYGYDFSRVLFVATAVTARFML